MRVDDFKMYENLEKKWKTYLYILTGSSIFFIYVMLEYLKIRTPFMVEYFNFIPFFFLLLSWKYWLTAFRSINSQRRQFDYDEFLFYSRKSSINTRIIDLLIAAFYLATIIILFIVLIIARWYY